MHPRWSAGFLREPRIGWGNLPDDGLAAAAFSAQTNRQFDPAATWDDVGWFREQWDGRLVVKGILRPEDARQAVRLGAEAIIVSNHGGRQLDGAQAAIRALPAVAEAIAGEAEVYFDSEIHGRRRHRQGNRARRAGLLGRARTRLRAGRSRQGWGEPRYRDSPRDRLRTALALTGCPSVQALGPSWVHGSGAPPSGPTGSPG